jgi:hypothetical protein
MEMEAYHLGRFSLSVPASLKIDGQSTRFRKVEVIESKWPMDPQVMPKKQMENAWKQHLLELHNLRKPSGVRQIIIEERAIPSGGHSAKAVYYYGNYSQSDEGFCDILIDAGGYGVWFKYHGLIEAKERMFEHVFEIAKAYSPFGEKGTPPSPSGNFFCLRYGGINLPYRRQESTYTRFQGKPSEPKVEVEMTETHKNEQKEEGLLARAVAAIVTGFASGIDIKKIRSRDKEVAGMKGEEQVVEMKHKEKTELDFTWRYAGKKDIGEHPKILISMESPEGDLEERLKTWDAILSSMKPLYNTSP